MQSTSELVTARPKGAASPTLHPPPDPKRLAMRRIRAHAWQVARRATCHACVAPSLAIYQRVQRERGGEAQNPEGTTRSRTGEEGRKDKVGALTPNLRRGGLQRAESTCGWRRAHKPVCPFSRPSSSTCCPLRAVRLRQHVLWTCVCWFCKDTARHIDRRQRPSFISKSRAAARSGEELGSIQGWGEQILRATFG